MIICHCTGVTDRDILRLRGEGLSTVGDVVRRCGAGRCCSPCRDEIAALLGQEPLLAAVAD